MQKGRINIKLQHHIITSLIVSVVIYAVSRSLALALGFLLGGVLIDVDHFIEYFNYRGFCFNLRDMFYLSYNNLYPKLYLVLHSYEILILIWIAGLFVIRSNLLIGLALGLTIHMVMDQISNSARAFSYFFTYRAIKRFDGDSIRRPGTKGKPNIP